MLKYPVTYDNFDEESVTEDLYFHIGKADFIVNPNLRADLENLGRRMQKMAMNLAGPERELKESEKQEMIDTIVEFMKFSYGERSEDGSEFDKRPEVWERFTRKAAFDAFILQLFQSADSVIQFMLGVMPKDIREEAEATLLDTPLPSLEDTRGKRVASVTPIKTDLEVGIPDEDLSQQHPDEDVDIEALEAEFAAMEQGQPVGRQQAEFMQRKLSKNQFDRWMVGKYIQD